MESDAVKTTQQPLYERWLDLLPAAGAVAENDPYAQLSDKQMADLAMLATHEEMMKKMDERKAKKAAAKMAEGT